MPAEKYSWRPGEGVRSVGEVYTHIVAANYGVAGALGTLPLQAWISRVSRPSPATNRRLSRA